MDNVFNHKKLQERIDHIALESGVKAILVMKSHPKEMEVVLSGGEEGRRVYYPKDLAKKSTHPKGKYPLYCEEVINANQLLEVQKASKHEKWKYNGDWVEFGLGTYIGLPIEHKGKVVGTVCALHDKYFDFRKKEYNVLDQLKKIKNEVENLLIQGKDFLVSN